VGEVEEGKGGGEVDEDDELLPCWLVCSSPLFATRHHQDVMPKENHAAYLLNQS